MLQSKLCSCADRNCFHVDCACFTTEGICNQDCACRAECKNILRKDELITKKFAEYTKNKPAAPAAGQAAAGQAAAQSQPKPLPAREPGNTSQSAVKTNFVSNHGCACRKNGCNLYRCLCFMEKVRCTSKCKCLASICLNRGGESNAEPGGQRGTSSTPDGGTSQTLASVSSTAQSTSQTQPLVWSSSAAQTLPSSSVVATLAPDTKTKPLLAREQGSTQNPCRCDKSKCKNMYCVCFKAGLPCCDRCECKDCDNTKASEVKLLDLFPGSGIKGEVPGSGSGTSTMAAGAALAAKESAMGCKCQSECASRCGCVKRNIKCTSKCECKRCGNDDGSRFPKEGPGGQGGTRSSSSSAVESAGKRPKHA